MINIDQILTVIKKQGATGVLALWLWYTHLDVQDLKHRLYDCYGKKLWVQENIPGTKLILAKRENKRDYANRKSILIDDRTDNINDWNTAGGIGILFTSTSQTINELKELGL